MTIYMVPALIASHVKQAIIMEAIEMLVSFYVASVYVLM